MLATQRKHETAMAAPIRRDVGDRPEAMRDAVVELIFVLVLFTRRKVSGGVHTGGWRHEGERRLAASELLFEIHLVTTC